MKKIIGLFLIIFVSSCSKNDEEIKKSPIVGNWKLTEILVDPGDGSGIYTIVNGNKMLSFNRKGNLSCSSSLCEVSVDSNIASTGYYSESDSTIVPSNCPNLRIEYELNVDTLSLIYPCYEACVAKYIRTK